MLHSLQTRFTAIGALQKMRARHLPGSERYELAEQAIDLVLGDVRKVDKFLIRNALRDAGRIQTRQAMARRNIPLPDDSGEEVPDPSFPSHSEPFEWYATNEFIDQLERHIRPLSPHASSVLAGMVADESLHETAETSGLSASRVNQLRRMIRIEVRRFLCPQSNSPLCTTLASLRPAKETTFINSPRRRRTAPCGPKLGVPDENH